MFGNGWPSSESTARPSLGSLAVHTGLLLVTLALARFCYRLYQVRMMFRAAVKDHGVPLLPHSFLFGHLVLVTRTVLKHPPDLLVMALPQLIAEDYPELAAQHGLFYLDSWPFAYPMLAVCNPDLIAQFTQDTSMPKHPTLQTEFAPYTECRDLLNLEGAEWKMWRAVFNPGFSVKNLMALVPAFVDEIAVFREWLGSVADSGRVVALDDQASALAADVIGRATLDVRMNCQVEQNVFYNAVKDQVKHLIVDGSPPSILKMLDPRRPFRIRRNNRIMEEYLTPLIEHEANKHIRAGTNGNGNGTAPLPKEEGSATPTPKTIVSLAVKAYMDETQSQTSASHHAQARPGTTTTKQPKLDPTFVATAIAQIKIFVLAGHDTTSAALSFAYHLLHKHPATLRLIREEHDRVLGPCSSSDPSTLRATLAANPQLLNQLPYTSAVIKESLRLYPPAASVRVGNKKGHCLVHPQTGQRYPTEGFMLFSCHVAAHRDPAFWPRAEEFVPERWLAREGDPLHVRKNAFRAFELGPRNCIGQELAQLELRAILAMTIRDFDIEAVYPSDDEEEHTQGGQRKKGAKKKRRNKVPQWKGDKCYPSSNPGDFATGHPKDSLPVKVSRRAHVPEHMSVDGSSFHLI